MNEQMLTALLLITLATMIFAMKEAYPATGTSLCAGVIDYSCWSRMM